MVFEMVLIQSLRLGVRFRHSILWFTILSILFPSPYLAAEIEEDTHSLNHSTPGQSERGIPVVNIAAPSDSGVSKNDFKSFNVDASGLIINNSLEKDLSVLGGVVNANSNLKGKEADLILFGVTGSDVSRVLGQMELFGGKADFVLSNPNGLYLNGASFINMPSVTLTTGEAQFSSLGKLSGYAVSRGDVFVDYLGLDARQSTYFDIIARATHLNGLIQGGVETSIYFGKQLFDLTHKTSTPLSDPPLVVSQPDFGLDASALGSIISGQIRLVGTEKGLGVNLLGVLMSDQGDITLTAEGDIVYRDSYSARDLNVESAQKLTHQGETVAGRSLVLSSGADLSLSGGFLFASDDLTIHSKKDMTFLPGDSETLKIKSSAIDLFSGGTLYMNRTHVFSGMGGIHVQSDGPLNLLDKTALFSEKEMDLKSLGDLSLAGTIESEKIDIFGKSIAQSGVLSTDHLRVFSGDIFLNRGAVQSILDAKIDAHRIENLGGVLDLGGTVEVNAPGGVSNVGGTLLLHQLTYDGVLDNRKGKLVLSDSQASHFASILNEEGQVWGLNSFKASFLKGVNNQGGILVALGDLSLSLSSDYEHQGTLQVQGNLDIQANTIVNKGALLSTGYSHFLSLGNFDNYGSIRSDGDLLIHSNTGKVSHYGSIFSGGDFSLFSGQSMVLSEGSTLTGLKLGQLRTPSFFYNSGKIQSGDDLSLFVGHFSNANGFIGTLGRLTYDGGSDLNNAHGQLSMNQLFLSNKNLLNTEGKLHLFSTDSREGHLSLLNATFVNSSGLFLTEGVVGVDAYRIQNHKGGILSQGALTLRSPGIDNTEGRLISSDFLTVLLLETRPVSRPLVGSGANIQTGSLPPGLFINVVQVGPDIEAEPLLPPMNASFLDNRLGLIQSGTYLDLNLTQGRFNNSQGQVLSQHSSGILNVSVGSSFLNTEGKIYATGGLKFNSKENVVFEGLLEAGNEFYVYAPSITNKGILSSHSLLSVASAGNFDNQGQLVSDGNFLAVLGGRFLNDEKASLSVNNDGSFVLYGDFDNKGRLSFGRHFYLDQLRHEVRISEEWQSVDYEKSNKYEQLWYDSYRNKYVVLYTSDERTPHHVDERLSRSEVFIKGDFVENRGVVDSKPELKSFLSRFHPYERFSLLGDGKRELYTFSYLLKNQSFYTYNFVESLNQIYNQGVLWVGGNLGVRSTSTLTNSGTMQSDGEFSIFAEQGILNTKGTLSSKRDLFLVSEEFIGNLGGVVHSDQSLSLSTSQGSIVNDSSTQYRDGNPSVLALETQAELTAGSVLRISSAKDYLSLGAIQRALQDIQILAQEDIVLAPKPIFSKWQSGSGQNKDIHYVDDSIESLVQSGRYLMVRAGDSIDVISSKLRIGDSAYFDSGKNTLFGASYLTDYSSSERAWEESHWFSTDSYYEFSDFTRKTSKGSDIQVGDSELGAGTFLVHAGGDAVILGSDVWAKNALVQALNISQLAYTANDTRSSFTDKSNSLNLFFIPQTFLMAAVGFDPHHIVMSSNKSSDSYKTDVLVPSIIAVNANLVYEAGKDLIISGSKVFVKGDARFTAGDSILITSAPGLTSVETKEEHLKLASFQTSRTNSSATLSLVNSGNGSETDSLGVRQLRSLLSVGGSLLLESQGNIAVLGSVIDAMGDVLFLAKKDVFVSNQHDSSSVTSTLKSISTAVNFTIGNAWAGMVDTVVTSVEEASDSYENADTYSEKGKALIKYYKTLVQIAKLARIVQSAVKAGSSSATYGFYGEVSVTRKESGSSFSEHVDSLVFSDIRSQMGHLVFDAGNQLSVKGSLLLANSGNIDLLGRTLFIGAGYESRELEFSEYSHSQTITYGGTTAASFSLSGSLETSKSFDSRTHNRAVNSLIRAENGVVTLKSEQDAHLVGVDLLGGRLNVSVGGILDIASAQDSEVMQSGSDSLSLGNSHIGFTYTESSSDRLWMNSRSHVVGLNGGTIVANTLHLKGATLTSGPNSTGLLVDVNYLDVGSLVNVYDQHKFGVGLKLEFSDNKVTRGTLSDLSLTNANKVMDSHAVFGPGQLKVGGVVLTDSGLSNLGIFREDKGADVTRYDRLSPWNFDFDPIDIKASDVDKVKPYLKWKTVSDAWHVAGNFYDKAVRFFSNPSKGLDVSAISAIVSKKMPVSFSGGWEDFMKKIGSQVNQDIDSTRFGGTADAIETQLKLNSSTVSKSLNKGDVL